VHVCTCALCDSSHESTERREHLTLIPVLPHKIEGLPVKDDSLEALLTALW